MLLLSLCLSILPSFAFAYSFNFTNTPKQCGNLSLTITGSGGQPPYSILLIPYGPSTLPNNIEARRITQQNFSGTDTALSFQLKFPSNTQFVAVVSDASGFGSGGTSGAVTVQSTTNASCFDATQNVSPLFAFSIVPAGQITQCAPTRIWWDPTVVTGTPSFQGVIPGGQSFAIPESNLTTVAEQGLGFTWIPNVRGYTNMILVGGDDRGAGTAGSSPYSVNPGDNSCLSDASPSSTPGSPAGGSYPTAPASNGGSTTTSGSHSNVGAIVGGVIGGIVLFAAILLVAVFFYRRRNFHKSQKERPVDLFRDDDHEQDALANSQLPPHYEPEPFLAQDPTIASTSEDEMTDRRHSAYTSLSGFGSALGAGAGAGGLGVPGSAGARSPTPTSMGTSTYFRKSPAPPSFRPVNIVQHEDAGPSEAGGGDLETIELPPAYTNLRMGPRVPAVSTTTADTAEIPPPTESGAGGGDTAEGAQS